jgi:cell division septum initiation protein DivIVA
MPGSARRVTTDGAARHRSQSPTIANGRDRFGGADRARSGELPPRFPITRQGYDRAVVDERFAELEQEVIELDRELANMQASPPAESDAAAEISRLGAQVSAILIAAHDSAEETRRLAEAEAERRIAGAESRARSLTEDANRGLRRLQDETASLERERDRLLDDIRSIADRLRALADKPAEDLPADSTHDPSGG